MREEIPRPRRPQVRTGLLVNFVSSIPLNLKAQYYAFYPDWQGKTGRQGKKRPGFFARLLNSLKKYRAVGRVNTKWSGVPHRFYLAASALGRRYAPQYPTPTNRAPPMIFPRVTGDKIIKNKSGPGQVCGTWDACPGGKKKYPRE